MSGRFAERVMTCDHTEYSAVILFIVFAPVVMYSQNVLMFATITQEYDD